MCERWFWTCNIWVGRERGVERGYRWFFRGWRGEGGLDEGRLVEGIKREKDESTRQERRGDKTFTLQPRVMISCQVLTSPSRFRWSKLPSILLSCRLFFSPFFDVYSHLLCSLSVLCSCCTAFHPHISLSEISSFTLWIASQIKPLSCSGRVMLLLVFDGVSFREIFCDSVSGWWAESI